MKNVCCICGKTYEGNGHNAEPVSNGRCCDACYESVVVSEWLDSFMEHRYKENKELALPEERGFKRYPEGDFENEGMHFVAYTYKDTFIISITNQGGNIIMYENLQDILQCTGRPSFNNNHINTGEVIKDKQLFYCECEYIYQAVLKAFPDRVGQFSK